MLSRARKTQGAKTRIAAIEMRELVNQNCPHLRNTQRLQERQADDQDAPLVLAEKIAASSHCRIRRRNQVNLRRHWFFRRARYGFDLCSQARLLTQVQENTLYVELIFRWH